MAAVLWHLFKFKSSADHTGLLIPAPKG